MDASFDNILTDGEGLYFSDFGLALTSRFELSAEESGFLVEHVDFDRAYTTMHLVHHLAERMRGDLDRRDFVREWAVGNGPGDVPAARCGHPRPTRSGGADPAGTSTTACAMGASRCRIRPRSSTAAGSD